MEFQSLFILYVIFLVLGVSTFSFCARRFNRWLDSAHHKVEQLCSYAAPYRITNHGDFPGDTRLASEMLPRKMRNSSTFRPRSGAFVLLHLVLDALVFAEYTWEVVDYSLEMEINWILVFLPYVLITGKLYFYYKCCTSDPGRVTKQNVAFYIRVYKHDNIMFHCNNECPTCHLMKPARSKHCGVCGSCIHRFDNHCVWVNNCIGALNIRHFSLYLLSLTLTAACLAAVITAFFLQVVLLSHVMTAAYVDSWVHEEIASLAYVIQHLFLAFPRIVFTLGFLLLLILFLGGYTCFVWYLSITNRTTNEWYKARSISTSPKGYSRGIMGNLKEIFQPYTQYKKEK